MNLSDPDPGFFARSYPRQTQPLTPARDAALAFTTIDPEPEPIRPKPMGRPPNHVATIAMVAGVILAAVGVVALIGCLGGGF